MRATYNSYELIFKRPAGTSRGILQTKLTYFLKLSLESGLEFWGECGFFKGLSADKEDKYEEKLEWICSHIEDGFPFLIESCQEFPSIQFGLEQIQRQLKTEKKEIFYPSDFTLGKMGIPINGLIWMGSPDFMKEQIQQKLNLGFRCIKLKIGVNWEEEYKILKTIRTEFPSSQLELRVDANGGFSFEKAKLVLEQLGQLGVHSIEQPIKAGQIKEMAELCKNTPIAIALDEELIGKFYLKNKEELLNEILPQYLILKPSLIGGWSGSEQWIKEAKKRNISWWVTSALESNLGLNAIAQWTATLSNPIPQGLGTGALFTNNLASSLIVKDQKLYLNP